MKRTMLAVCLAFVMLLSLTACGGSAKSEAASPSAGNMAMDMATTESAQVEAPREELKVEAEMDYGGGVVYEESQSQSGSGQVATGQKLIRMAWLEMETTSFDEAVQGLSELTEEFGGYFENSSVANRKSGARWANYTIRVPTERYKAFLNQAGQLCHETWRETSEEDVSEIYYDTQGRLKTQQIKLERLQELLSKAELMEDIITIESAISETEWQIDNLSGTLRHYDGLVDYATVNVNISEVYKLSNVEEVPDTFGDRMGAAFSDGLRDFGDGVEDLAVSFAYSWMWWLLAAVVVVVIVRVARKGKRKLPKLSLRKRKNDQQDEG